MMTIDQMQTPDDSYSSIDDRLYARYFQPLSSDEEIALFAEKNSIDVHLDLPVYRIFKFEQFLNDFENATMTLVRASPIIWSEKYENPLLKHVIQMDGEEIHLDELMKNYYALCWTYNSEDIQKNWDSFAGYDSAVRVKTTVRKLMMGLMRTSDPYRSLRYFAGRVQYLTTAQIDIWRSKVTLHEILDSRGDALARTLFTVPSDYRQEKEVRILYSAPSQHDKSAQFSDVKFEGDLSVHRFSWIDVLEEIKLGAHVSESEEIRVREVIAAARQMPPISRTLCT